MKYNVGEVISGTYTGFSGVLLPILKNRKINAKVIHVIEYENSDCQTLGLEFDVYDEILHSCAGRGEDCKCYYVSNKFIMLESVDVEFGF
ncbi:MAG: hypothetical protein RR744_00190 [Cellulosilyticaceae bacterium]